MGVNLALNDEEFWRRTFALLDRGDSVSDVADKLKIDLTLAWALGGGWVPGWSPVKFTEVPTAATAASAAGLRREPGVLLDASTRRRRL
jgi:hypothetical protein